MVPGREGAPVTRQSSKADVAKFLAAMVGQPCWRVDHSYGDELTIELGGRHPGRRFRTREFGDWRVGSQGSEWTARDASGSTRSSSREPIKVAVRKLKHLEGTSIQAMSVDDEYRLVVKFSDGTVLEIQATPDPEVPYWEILGPEHQILIAGPGARCSILRSDMPLDEQ